MIDVGEKREQRLQSFWVNPGEWDVKLLLTSVEERTNATDICTGRHTPDVCRCESNLVLFEDDGGKYWSQTFRTTLYRFLLFRVAELLLKTDASRAELRHIQGRIHAFQAFFWLVALFLHLWWCNDESKSLSDPFMSAIRSNQPEKRKSSRARPKWNHLQPLTGWKLQRWWMRRMKGTEWQEMRIMMRSCPKYDQIQT